MKKLTTEQFIQRAKRVHENRYDYSRVNVNGADNKVTIICPIHGEFEQRAADHQRGRGCSLCNERQQLTKDQFVDRANKKHNSKYVYDQVVYINNHTKVKITCLEHGIFEQMPNDHLTGYGCPACGGVQKVTKEVFVERAKQVHGNTYDYSRLKIKGMDYKGIIICPTHGEFKQRLADHVDGVGCPICGKLKQGGYTTTYFTQHPEEKDRPAQLYLITFNDKFCKIGITAKQYVKQRFPGMQFKVVKIKKTSLYEAFQQEQDILNKFKKERYKIKDFKLQGITGWTECFSIDIVNRIKQEFTSCIE